MAQLLQLTTYKDKRGILTVLENVIPFEIKRMFYVYDVDDSAIGGHRHKRGFH